MALHHCELRSSGATLVRSAWLELTAEPRDTPRAVPAMDTEPESIIRCVKTSAVVRHVVVEPGCRAVTSHEASRLRARTVTP